MVKNSGPAIVLMQTLPKSAMPEVVVRIAVPAVALVTSVVYVLVVVPSCAVTTVVITLEPTLRGILPEATPLATVVPFTVMVALASAAVGVTVMSVMPFATVLV